MTDIREMSNAVAESWRSLWTDLRHLGVIDFKWLCVFFVGTVAGSWLVREWMLRRLERRNRLLRLISAAEAANDELRRRGSDRQVETDDVIRDL